MNIPIPSVVRRYDVQYIQKGNIKRFNTPLLSLAILSFLVIFSLLLSPNVTYAQSTLEMPVGLQKAYQESLHKIKTINQKDTQRYWQASNPANNMRVDFDGKGFTAKATKDDWQLSMELTKIGSPNNLIPVKQSSVQINDNRVTYDRGVLKEWYINDPKGVEQWFTLDKPLSKDQLVLQFDLDGDVKPTLMGDSQSLQFTTKSGKQLSYEKLKAWDATGKVLKAHMNLKDKALQLSVAVANAVYPITIDPVLVEQQKLTASDASAGDQFGRSVAIFANTAVIGANFEDAGGAAYVYVRTGSTWIEQAKLVASDLAVSDEFGISVGISGETIVVGSLHNDTIVNNTGSAYVFVRSGSSWSQQAKLIASDATTADWFGRWVSISDDTVVVGAYRDDDDGNESGSSYVFFRTGTTWSEQAKLTASDAAAGDHFGYGVGVSGDTAVVGGRYNDDAGTDSGSAYVFFRTGSTWSEQAKLTASDAAAGDFFGVSTAVSGDTVVIGAPFDQNANGLGAAYVFFRVGSAWSEQAKLSPTDTGVAGSVAISGDKAVLGAGITSTAYVFERTGSTWSEQDKLVPADVAGGDRFGISVAANDDAVIVGADLDDDAGDASGSAYIFGPPPPPAATLISPSGNILDSTPTYKWNKVVSATQYYLWVVDSTGIKIQNFYTPDEANCNSGNGQCSVTPTTAIADGDAQWWIQTSNTGGDGPWSLSLSFNVTGVPVVPIAATLISPSGNITDTTPTYTWNAVANSSYYFLSVDDSTGNVIGLWYTASQAGCDSGTGTCSITSTTLLAAGAGQWRIRTWNNVGVGPWSSIKNFNVGGDVPVAATLVSPSGTITDTTPTYIWNAVANSSWYFLWVNDANGLQIKKWYRASEAGCSGGTGTCSITPTTPLDNGVGRWWIQTWNTNGFGPWSSPLIFTVQ